MLSNQSKSGFTFIEIIIVVAIAAILLVIVGASFSGVLGNQELKRGSAIVRSVIDDARTRTLASRDASQYGVHFATTSTTLFKGAAYSSSDPDNEEVLMPERTELSFDITGGSDIVFDRLTGATTNTATITVMLISDPNLKRIIKVQATGLVSSE